MKKWKKVTASFMLSIVTLGSGLTFLEAPQASAAANAVPAYEVKFLAKPELVLNTDGTPRSEVIQTLGLNSTARNISAEYFDTNALNLNQAGWDVRFRKKDDKNNYELTYKKRYPVINGDVNAALTLANQEGFNASDDNYEAEIDWGYGKQTLSFSNTKKVDTNATGVQLPSQQEALSMLLDKLPGKLKNWSSSNWGKQQLTASRAYGPVTFQRYEGTWNGQELTLEVWPIRNATGSGVENIVEISFKTADSTAVSGLRTQLMQVLANKNWLIPADGLKTQLILERY
ncbi:MULTISPECIES: CYTH domain-containing protein [unclassified Paenibacillus]|uniref:CYTH domain-containing protein n=1 Tax=unclassified Paenibacillus TaxID=185978 RepID=UPI0009D1E282|nr:MULTISPECIES: CYTH domain-containing protein [unclassified Paenibacillus]SLK08766.1 CYTH domain-containing protein [Paenibacillus sp. RU5A]SOC71226.1 CYTH domain-containing protein [Paenibacillus sp. RU26A]SOC73728.1 CYTH domain-containing protein [Paenibacillus sp. RU5M]